MGKTRETSDLVSDNLFSTDISNDHIGIGSTQPSSKLDVSGDVNISGVITATSFTGTDIRTDSLLVTGISTFNGTGTEIIRVATQSPSASSQEEFGIGFAANVDDTNPSALITWQEFDDSDFRGELAFYTRTLTGDTAPTEKMRITKDGDIGIGTNNPNRRLDVRGSGKVAKFGTVDPFGDKIEISVADAGYPKILQDSSSDTLSLSSRGSIEVAIDSNNNSTGKVFNVVSNGDSGSGTNLLTINEDGNSEFSGIVTATSFSGDGSNLTGVANTDIISADSIVVSGVVTTSKLHVDPVGSGITFSEDLVVQGNARVTGILSIGTSSIILDSNTGVIRGINEISIGSSDSNDSPVFIKQKNGKILFKKTRRHNNQDVETDEEMSVGIGSTTSINTSGIITATSFHGNGSNLTGLTHSQVSGAMGDLVDDTTPQLGGNLDLNSNDITGTGNINITGDISATTVSIAGTLTYEDVTNVDSVGVITARSGVNVTGNITVTGTVDGRDIASDGTKLDGIEAGATGDQTASEIKTAYESNSDTNAFDDAAVSKLSGIEANATADQTASEILTAIKTVDGTGSGLDADTLDGVNSGSFLRSDADDTFTGTITGNSDQTNPVLVIDGGGPNIIRFPDDGSNTLGIDLVYRTTPHTLGFEKSTDGTQLWKTDCDDGRTTFSFDPYKDTNKIWHAGNDGASSGLDADTLDGYQTSSTGDRWGVVPYVATGGVMEIGRYIDFHATDGSSIDYTNRLDAGTSGDITLNGNKIWHAGNDGTGSGLDADTLDGLQASSFLRSGSSDTYSGGTLTIQSHSQSGAYQGWGLYYNSGWKHTNANSWGYYFRNQGGGLKISVAREAGTANGAATTNDYFFDSTTDESIRIAHTNSQQAYSGQHNINAPFYNTFTQSGSQYQAIIKGRSTGSSNTFIGSLGILHSTNGNHNLVLHSILSNGTGSLVYTFSGSSGTVWTSGNDGSGSGLDADTLDGVQGSNYLRSDIDDSTSGYLVANGFVGSGGALRIANPGGASFATTTATTTGYLKITLPVSWTNTMMSMTIKCYEYSTGESFEIHCGGYNYSPNSNWVNTFAYILGGNTKNRNFTVRFGHDGSKCAIYIGESNSTWSYFQFGVTEFLGGYTNYTADSWHSGWSCSITTSLGTITGTTFTTTQLNKYVDGNVSWHAGNDGAGSGLDADLFDGLDSSNYMRTNNSQTISARHIFNHNEGQNQDTIASSTGSQGGLEIRNSGSGNDAFIAFHASGDHAFYFGLDADTNDLSVGGWSKGANKYRVWHAGNDGSGSGLDADTLDGINSGSFLRSDAADTATGNLTLGKISTNDIVFNNTALIASDADGAFAGRTGNNIDHIWHNDSTNTWHFCSDTTYKNGGNSIVYAGSFSAAGNTVWHAGNDGSGSGLDADTLDGYQLSAIKTNSNADSNNVYIRNGSPTLFLRDTNHNVSMLHCNSNLLYVLRGATDATGWTQVNSQWPFIFYLTNNNAKCGGAFEAVGDVTAFSSDRRLKENFKHIDSPLEKVLKLNGYNFDWKEEVKELGFSPSIQKNDIGLIAQEVQEVVPQAIAPAPFDQEWDKDKQENVSKSGEDYLTVKYEKLVPLLVESIKELKCEIEELKSEIKTLKKERN